MTIITGAGHYNEFGENLNVLLSLVKCIQTFHFSPVVLHFSFTFLLSVAFSICLVLSVNKIYVVLSLSSALSRLNFPSIFLEFCRHYISQHHFFISCITSIPLLSSCFLFSRHHKFKQNHFVSSVSITSFFTLFFISSFILFLFTFSNFNFLKTTTTSVTNANSITIILIINLLIAISNYNKNSNPVYSFFTYLFTTKSIIFHYLLFFLLSLFLLSGRNFCTKFPHFSLLTDYCKSSSDISLYQQKQYEQYQLHNKHQNHENCYTLYLHCRYTLTFCQLYHQNRCQRHHYDHVQNHYQYHQLQQQQYHFQDHYLDNYRLYYNNNYYSISSYYSYCNSNSKYYPCIDKYIDNHHRNGSYNRNLNSNNKNINRRYNYCTYLLNYRNFYRYKQLQQICNHLYLHIHFLQFRHNLTYHYLQNIVQNSNINNSNNHNPYCYHYKYYQHNSFLNCYCYYYYYYHYHYSYITRQRYYKHKQIYNNDHSNNNKIYSNIKPTFKKTTTLDNSNTQITITTTNNNNNSKNIKDSDILVLGGLVA
uniref:Uncharacterized protein n=1 Tax=Octopus bimaculoides TaxID=37653 RepID=A0A0L8FF34_OCTBM